MKSRILLGLLVVFLGFGAGVGPANAPPAHAQGARMCAPTNAEKATVAAIASDPAAWTGKCVTLPAMYSNEQLYADQDAIYGANKNVIGGFADGKGTIEGFWSGQFTGRVADCAAAERELALGLLRSPGISVNGRTMGCLEPKGPFLLFMSQRDLKPVTLTRRLRKQAGPDGGDLKPAPADWAQLPAVQKAAGEIIEALRNADRAALSHYGMRDFAIERVLGNSDTAIADLRKPGEIPAQVFVHASSDAAFKSEACYCRSKDCSAKWPIARRDADNQASRPYTCIAIDGRKDGAAWVLEADASQDFDGLPEPR
ncbi:MAG TPA: hypothetical protein VGO52_10200 [Hyphomonadaceae bacterium]|jgi:hypothetical protein|nr:hypothetical protein [Hyphomonadaceae bacterium]